MEFLRADRRRRRGRWALQDGSGLSRSDLVTPHGLVSLLAAMDRHPHAAAFRDSLPVAGVDGTLEHRMRGTRRRRGGSWPRRAPSATSTPSPATRQPARASGWPSPIVRQPPHGPAREAVAAIDADRRTCWSRR